MGRRGLGLGPQLFAGRPQPASGEGGQLRAAVFLAQPGAMLF